jgi:osmotically-inducible protein OsmY
MSTRNQSANDLQLRDNVLWQLEWDPAVDAAAIGVAAIDATVTLTGYVNTYAGKLAAERAAKQVRGVRAVANDIEVRPMLDRTDTDIADDVVYALRLHSNVPDSVQATVRRGYVVLGGRVDFRFQKEAAEEAIRHLRGVRHIDNHIEIAAKSVARDVRKHIVKALHQNAIVDADHIEVSVTGSMVTLTGSTGSLAQLEAAEWAAAQTPGIAEVENRLVVVNRDLSELASHAAGPEH